MAGLLGTSAGETGPETGEQRVTFGTVSLLLRFAELRARQPQIVHQPHLMLYDQGSLHSHLSLFSRSSGSTPYLPNIPMSFLVPTPPTRRSFSRPDCKLGFFSFRFPFFIWSPAIPLSWCLEIGRVDGWIVNLS